MRHHSAISATVCSAPQPTKNFWPTTVCRRGLNRQRPGRRHVVNKRNVPGLLASLNYDRPAVHGVPQPLEDENLAAHIGADDHAGAEDDRGNSVGPMPGPHGQLGRGFGKAVGIVRRQRMIFVDGQASRAGQSRCRNRRRGISPRRRTRRVASSRATVPSMFCIAVYRGESKAQGRIGLGRQVRDNRRDRPRRRAGRPGGFSRGSGSWGAPVPCSAGAAWAGGVTSRPVTE